jgi:hypothetical protein
MRVPALTGRGYPGRLSVIPMLKPEKAEMNLGPAR